LKRHYLIAISLILIIVAVGFTFYFISINRGYGNPTAKEILNDDSDADIIKVDDVIYLKADNKPDGDYSKGEEIGEIKKKTANKWWFRNLYASKLDKGTKVYSIDEEYQDGDAPFVILVEVDGELTFYQALLEG